MMKSKSTLFINNISVTFEQKVQFTEKVRRLTNEGLTRLVKKVKEICDDALEDVDSEKFHIKVDLINSSNFETLLELVEEELKDKGAVSLGKR
jgi:hypothetical protein